MQQKLAAIMTLEAIPPSEGQAAGALSQLAVVQCELVDPTISRFGGRIFALTRTRTLVEFAEPARAVACGLEIQRGLGERQEHLPQLGIGIELGEVMSESGDLRGEPVLVARGLARIAGCGVVAVSGKVARTLDPRRTLATRSNRGTLAIEGAAEVQVVELRPAVRPRAQSPWTLRRRWTWVAAIAAAVLLAGASVVLWRPIREALIETTATSTAPAARALQDQAEDSAPARISPIE